MLLNEIVGGIIGGIGPGLLFVSEWFDLLCGDLVLLCFVFLKKVIFFLTMGMLSALLRLFVKNDVVFSTLVFLLDGFVGESLCFEKNELLFWVLLKLCGIRGIGCLNAWFCRLICWELALLFSRVVLLICVVIVAIPFLCIALVCVVCTIDTLEFSKGFGRKPGFCW
jgi:hypothetical protein